MSTGENFTPTLRYLTAIAAYYGHLSPSRKKLSELGKLASGIAGRKGKPWTGAYLYICMRIERYEGFSINPDLTSAIEQLANIGTFHTEVRTVAYGKEIRVDPGARILVSSKRCLVCDVAFVPADHNQCYCSKDCRKEAKKLSDKGRKR